MVRPHCSKKEIVKMIRLWESGCGTQGIARVMNRSDKFVYRHLDKRGMGRKRRPIRPWTGAEQNRMRRLWEAGFSDVRIGINLKRSPEAIRHKRNSFKIYNRKYRRWTEKEETFLRKKVLARMNTKRIAYLLDRSYLSIMERMSRLGLRANHRGRRIWTDEMVAKVKALRESGLTYEKIAKEMGDGIKTCSAYYVYTNKCK